MDEKPRPIAELDDDETADSAAASGPLGRLVEQEIAPGTVESADTAASKTPGQRTAAQIEYAAGTTEHDDDREG